MKMYSAKVVNGRIDLRDTDLPDGTTVTVLAADDEAVELTTDQMALLRKSLRQADRGEAVDAFEFLDTLRQ